MSLARLTLLIWLQAAEVFTSNISDSECAAATGSVPDPSSSTARPGGLAWQRPPAHHSARLWWLKTHSIPMEVFA